MAKLQEVSDELKEMAERLVDESSISKQVKIELLGFNKSKEVTKVMKASELVEHYAQDNNLVIIFVYERAFDKVDEKTREMWLRSAISQISYDFEKDKIETTCPTITVPIGMYHTYGSEAIDKAELAQLTIEQIIAEDKELKENQKASKTTKKRR